MVPFFNCDLLIRYLEFAFGFETETMGEVGGGEGGSNGSGARFGKQGDA